MIIRSQNKRIITTDLNLHIEPRDSRAIGNVTCWIKNETMGILATYSSWEKAIKVLDMIQNAYERHTMFSITYQDGILAELEKRNGLDTARDSVSPIFNMPSDESVEV